MIEVSGVARSFVAAAPAHELGYDGGVESRAALRDPAHGVGELADVRDAILEQVADALGAVSEQFHRVGRLDVLGEHEHAGFRVLLPDLPGGA